jgi:quercetin dioxygenase-like cupin family protein
MEARRRRWGAMAAGGLLLLAAPARPQADAIRREPLADVPFPGNGLHTLMIRTTLAPGGIIARHRHPGQELAYVLSGGVAVTIGAAGPRPVAAGQAFTVTPREPHLVRNPGSVPAVILSTYIVDPAEPLATPLP